MTRLKLLATVIRLYQPIVDIIEKESMGRLDSTLYIAAYYLNPYY